MSSKTPNIVAMVYRDEYYNSASPAAGTAEIIVRKHRNGRTGTAYLTFIAEHARFENYSGRALRQDPMPSLRSVGRVSSTRW